MDQRARAQPTLQRSGQVTQPSDAALAALGLNGEDDSTSATRNGKELTRRTILEMLDRGDIDAAEATRRLREM